VRISLLTQAGAPCILRPTRSAAARGRRPPQSLLLDKDVGSPRLLACTAHKEVFVDRYSPGRSVLIVDDSRDSREVLRAVLELRGWKIFEADDAQDGLAKAEELHPDVIVLDTDTSDDCDLEASFDNTSKRNNASLVVIGQARYTAPPTARHRVVAKPYHYAPLVRTIDELAASALAKAG
jgi:ActR/RegA family two-component response regulator